MFDVYGLVSDLTQAELEDENLFECPEGSVLDSAKESGVYRNDTVNVAGTNVVLDRVLYHTCYLGDEDLHLRPILFAKLLLAPAVRAVADVFDTDVADAKVVVTRAPKIPQGSYGGDYLSINDVYLRWFLDYDRSYVSDRLYVDAYVGTANEIKGK